MIRERENQGECEKEDAHSRIEQTDISACS